MRELITEQEVEILRVFADNAMRVNQTANDVHYNRKTVYRILADIYGRTGRNPLNFWDLKAIFNELEKEGESGR